MSTSRNFSVYREIIHSANPPVIPFLGFYLTDLTFLEDGNPDYIVVGAAKSSGDIDNPTESASEIHPPSSSSTPSLAVAHFSNSRSSISSDNLQIINFAKRAKTAEVIREIQQFQNSPYLLTPVLELQDFLRQCFLEVPEENDLYDLSLHLEPRER